MDYNVKTRILLNTNFNTSEFNDLMYESTKPHIIEDIKSVIEEDPTLPQYIHGDLTFCFLSNYKVQLKYQFVCNDENEAEAESFSKSCVEDIREELEGKDTVSRGSAARQKKWTWSGWTSWRIWSLADRDGPDGKEMGKEIENDK